MAVEINSLFKLKMASSPQYSSNGEKVAYVISTMKYEQQTYYSEIVIVDLATKKSYTIPSDFSLNTQPMWHPTEEKVAYLAETSQGKVVYLFDCKTMRINRLTNFELSISSFVWQPLGEGIYFTAKLMHEVKQPKRYYTRIHDSEIYTTETILYQENGTGFLEDGFQQVVCYCTLFSDHYQEIGNYTLGYGLKKAVGISREGRYLAIEQSVDSDIFNSDTGIYLCDLVNQQSSFITQPIGIYGEPVFSQDSQYLAVIGNGKRYQTINQLSVHIYHLQTKKWQEYLVADDIQVTDFCVSDTKQNATNSQLQWSDVTNCFYTVVSVDGKVALYEINPISGETKVVTAKDEHITDFIMHPTKPKVLLAVSSPFEPCGLYQVNLVDGTREALLTTAELNSFLKDEIFAHYEKKVYISEDGGKVPVIIARPHTLEKEKKYPVILNIHGGPYTMHGFTFHHEVQCMVEKGYVVLLVNPRGSFGYGQFHLDGVLEKYGKGDYQDLMKAIDGCLVDYPFLDEERLFVTGGSYGGYMTNWIVTQTNRFKAAATQRSMSNFVSMVGTGDIGFHFFIEETGADITKPEKLWKQSPLAHVQNVQTPMLILHSEEDLRCPMEQAEQWFAALCYLKQEARLVRFAKENHELSRSGKAAARVVRLEEILGWFERFSE